MRFLPTLGRGRPETKGAIDRRHSAAPYYVPTGVAYQPPLQVMDVQRSVEQQWQRDVWVFKCVHTRAIAATKPDVKLMDGRGKDAQEVARSRLALLLNRKPNNYEDRGVFRYRFQTLADLSRKGVFVEAVERSGFLESVHLLNPQHVYPIPNPDTFVEAFEMRLPNGEVFDSLPPYQSGQGGVLWFKRGHPTDPYMSSTWLDACGLSIELDYYARVFNRNFLFNDGRPGGVLAVKGEDGLEPGTVETLLSRLGGGPGMAGKVTALEAESLEYVDLSTTPRDAQYVESRAITKEEIIAAAGTPESLWNASGRTFDNADAEERGFWRNEMQPELGLHASFWEQLTPGGVLDDSQVVAWDWTQVPVLNLDDYAAEARAQAEFNAGLITADEYRERTGKEPMDVPGSRVVWISQGKAPVGDKADVDALLGTPVPPPGAIPAEGELGPPPPPPGELEPAPNRPALPPGGAVNEEPVVEGKARPAAARAEHRSLVDGWVSEVERELTALLRRQEQIVLARLGGAKARKHTRHWEYQNGAPLELKALDATYIVERRRWVEEVVAAVADVIMRAFGSAGLAIMRRFGIHGQFEPTPENRAEVVAKTVRLIAEEFDGQAAKLQRVIADGDRAGKSIDEIAEDVRGAYIGAHSWAKGAARHVVGPMNAASLIGAAQSGAVAKRWLSTDDDRTRPSHRKAEGQVRPLNEPFDVGGADLEFPGDPTGPLDEIWNCRCTMLFQAGERDYAGELAEDLGEEWKLRHVATQAGVRRYGKPIGSPLIGGSDDPDRMGGTEFDYYLSGGYQRDEAAGQPRRLFSPAPPVAARPTRPTRHRAPPVKPGAMTSEEFDYYMAGQAASDAATGRPLRAGPHAGEQWTPLPPVAYPHATYDGLGSKGRAAVDAAKAKWGITDESLDAAVARNFDEHPAEAAAGQDWYSEQGRAFAERVADQYDAPIEEAIGVTAATSPRARWNKVDGSPGANQLAVMDILANRERFTTGDWKGLSDDEVAHKLPFRVMTQYSSDGVGVARGEPLEKNLGGPKRPAFYNAIADPDSDFDAPVDTFMSRIVGYASTKGSGPDGIMSLDETEKILGAHPTTTNGGIGHVLVGDALRRRAKRTGLAPSQVQAGWWVVERDFHNTYEGAP